MQESYGIFCHSPAIWAQPFRWQQVMVESGIIFCVFDLLLYRCLNAILLYFVENLHQNADTSLCGSHQVRPSNQPKRAGNMDIKSFFFFFFFFKCPEFALARGHIDAGRAQEQRRESQMPKGL